MVQPLILLQINNFEGSSMRIPLVPLKDSIATRLLKVVFSFYLILATTVTVTHMVAEYMHTRNLVLQELVILEKTFQPSLEQALWEMNKAQLDSTLKGIMELPNIVGVKIVTPKGIMLGEMGQVLPQIKTKFLDKPTTISGIVESSSGLFWNTFRVIHKRGDKSFLVGVVTIYSSRFVVIDKVKFSFLFLIINAGIKIIGFWILFLWISRVLLSRPLAELTYATQQVQLDNLENVKIKVNVKSNDELKVLGNAFSTMIQNLVQTRSELYKSKEQLEMRVVERTIKLEESQELYKKQYEETHKTKELYHSLLESAPDAIVTYDNDGKTQYINPAFVRTFGWTLDEIIEGVPYTPDSESEITMTNIMKVIKDGIPVSDFETRRYTKDGEVLDVSISASRFHDIEDQPVGMLVILRNITERKQLEENFKFAKEKAESANQAKSTFLANMSHELRTPLNAILGFSQIMANGENLEIEQKKNLQIINRSGEHLLTLINDILDMSKIEAGQITLKENDMDLFALLDDVKNLFKVRVENKGLSLTIEPSANIPKFIRTDEAKLRQILTNLVGNAVKFTEEGGITVRVGIKTDWQNKQVAENEKIRLGFEVADTGSGIATSDLEQLFDPFVQTSVGQKSHEGTGLGLPISQKFVELMGGDINVLSQEEHGTTFQFMIDVQKGNPEKITVAAASQIIGLQSDMTYRILIVDDSASNRDLLRQLLVPIGFDIQEAESGQAAIAMNKEWQPHLILMDIRMPSMDGYETTRQIKKASQGKKTTIIAVSASVFEDKKEDALSAGCEDFIAKPFKESEVFEKIKKHLGLEYVIKELPRQEDILLENHRQTLPAKKLNDLPVEWKISMIQAIEHVDLEEILIYINQLRKQDDTLASAIQARIDQFEYEQVIEALS